jgi:hypothetical protein
MTNRNPFSLLPVVGVALFFLLYFVAASKYSGGNSFDKHEPGFSLTRNFWCHLLNEKCLNGNVNTGRPYALTGMLVLAATMIIFCWQNASLLPLTKTQAWLMLFSGVPAALILVFIFTDQHDRIINISGLLSAPVLYLILFGLYRKGSHCLWIWGIGNIVLVLLNNFLYYTSGFLVYLPIVQKLSFLSFLLWFSGVSIGHWKDRTWSTSWTREQ